MTVPIKLIQIDNQDTEKHPWLKSQIILIVGGIGSGKSTLLFNILNQISHENFNRCIFFSSNALDSKMSNLSEDVEVYGADKQKLLDVVTSIQQNALNAKKSGKKKLPKILLILDDMAGSDFFSSSKNFFNTFLLSVRHYNVTCIITTQKLRLINQSIRNNAYIWFISKLTQLEKDAVFEEVPIPKAKLEKAYSLATSDPYGWLQINIPKRLLIKNFDEEIVIQ